MVAEKNLFLLKKRKLKVLVEIVHNKPIVIFIYICFVFPLVGGSFSKTFLLCVYD